MEKQLSNKYLNSLQGIRALATIAIFLFHSGFLLNGTFPVTLFFMLSGFMMYYTKSDLSNYHSFKEWISKYIVKKLKQFYPIHLLTFCIAVVISIPVVINTEWIKAAILNLCLLQSTVEKYAIGALGFNGLSWYLSVTIILYFLSYYLIKFVRKVTKVVPVICIVLILLEVVNQLSFKTYLYLYSNPMYRVLDFVLGMLIASLYMKKEKLIIKKSTVWEILLVIVFVLQYILSFFVKTGLNYYSLVFAVALYVFAEGKGKISAILSCKPLMFVAKYSFEFYMVHELMLRIFRKVFNNMESFYPIKLSVIAFPALICSVLLVFIVSRIKEKYEK